MKLLYRRLTRDLRETVLKGTYAGRDATMDALRASTDVYRDLTRNVGERSPVLRGANAARYAAVDTLRDSRDSLRGLYRNDIVPQLNGFRSNVQDGLVELLGGSLVPAYATGGTPVPARDPSTSGFDFLYTLFAKKKRTYDNKKGQGGSEKSGKTSKKARRTSAKNKAIRVSQVKAKLRKYRGKNVPEHLRREAISLGLGNYR